MPAFGTADGRSDDAAHELCWNKVAVIDPAGTVILLDEQVTKLTALKPRQSSERGKGKVHALGQMRMETDGRRENVNMGVIDAADALAPLRSGAVLEEQGWHAVPPKQHAADCLHQAFEMFKERRWEVSERQQVFTGQQ